MKKLTAPIRGIGGRRLVLLAGLGAAGFGFGYLGCWPPMATVMSASMAPEIETGDVVLLKRLGRAPRPGDVIAVSVPDEARSRFGYPATVVHRVVRVANDGRITTRGDARPRVDPFTVPRSAAQARVVATVPGAGRVFAFLTSPMGLMWLAAGAVLLVGLPLLERQRDVRDAEQETLAALHEELRRVHDEVAMLRSEAQVDRPDRQATPERPLPRRSGGLVGSLARLLG
jgi:signal peptidase I